MNKLHLYFRTPPTKDRFFFGDRFIIPTLRRLIKGRKTGGVEKVFINLKKGFDELKIDYDVNLPFDKIKAGEPVVVLGNGHFSLKGYHQPNPIIAGIGLMTHPSEWPSLCKDYPVVKYLQHSGWARNVYVPYYGNEVCDLWPAGIETEKWSPDAKTAKSFDVLIYNKIRWDKSAMDTELRSLILKYVSSLDLTYREIVYGDYKETEYLELLKRAKAMVFLCEHESQGIACCEALSTDVPVFAWDQGFCLDPNRFNWGDPVMPATSVPFFDDNCGKKFKDYSDFESKFDVFWKGVLSGGYHPREYVLKNLTLKKSAERMLEIVNRVYE